MLYIGTITFSLLIKLVSLLFTAVYYYKVQLYSRRAILERIAAPLALTRWRFSRAIDLIKYDGLWPTHGGGKSRGYRGDNGSGFFSPSSICFNDPMDTYPSYRSEYLGSLAWCFLDSVAWVAAVANNPASNVIIGFSGKVMDTSNAAVLPKNQSYCGLYLSCCRLPP